VDRAILLSHPKYQQKNLEFCIEVLQNNGYSLELIFKKIQLRLKKLFNMKINKNNEVLRDENTEITEKKLMVMPYIRNITETIASTINKNEFMIGFRCLNKLDRFIKTHKDRNAPNCNNNVIYKVSCNDCNASYVGQTKRKLKTRLKEHKNNIRLNSSKHSVISEHILNYGHTFDWENTQILDSEPNYYKRLISEMIHIKEQQNGINLNTDTELLDNSYFAILDKLKDL
jgi:hypothetical protein